MSKSNIRILFLLKLILSIELMRPILDKRSKVRHDVQEHVADTLNDRIRLLSLVQRVAQSGVDGNNVVQIPKYLCEEIGSLIDGNDIGIFESPYPCLIDDNERHFESWGRGRTSRRYSISRTKSRSVYITSLMAS